jgi:non-specific protein-tyrosine kinase
MDLRRISATVLHWLWLLLLIPILTGAGAFVISNRLPRIYEAKSTILVNQAQTISGPTYSDVLANQQLSKTYHRMITSAPVLQRVAEKLGYAAFDDLDATITPSIQGDSQLIDITVSQRDPELAARIADATAQSFADQIRQAQLDQQALAERDLQEQITAARTGLEGKERALAELFGASAGGPIDGDRQRRISDAQYEVDTARRTLSNLESLMQQLRLELTKGMSSVSLVNPAQVPVSPVRPRVVLNTVLGAMLGVLLAAGVIALREALDGTVRTPEAAVRAANAPLLGGIPLIGRARWRLRGGPAGKPVGLIVGRPEYRPVEDALRRVRTNFEFARNGHSGAAILITSATPHEGKSTTLANMAVLLGQAGRRVILLDADLRQPVLHRFFQTPNQAGLSTLLLAGDPCPEPVLCATACENVRLVPSGPAPANPAELLSSPKMATVVTRLKAQADVVLLDSGPLLAVADTAPLAGYVDGVVLVVDATHTQVEELSEAAEVAARANVPIWGVVLNKLKRYNGTEYHSDPALLDQKDGEIRRWTGVAENKGAS